MSRAQRFLDKRTWDDRLYDIDCADLLDNDEVILSATIKADDALTNGLTFGAVMVNPAPIIYPLLNRTAQIGKACQVYIIGGVIPEGAPDQLCTLRLRMVTSINPQLEATVLLRLIDSAP